ncbi:myelin P2 protein-like [Mya arenaria]|uniref:myelin P2 protein-like n=1 Tax=Mya arenaria TaxID=6604 RepID=UPI0022E84C37|nr:myelin P2 protein-like [Mya arenaria]
MSNATLVEINEKFGGTWKLDRSEHFADFLKEVGVNIVVRKMASLAKPSSTLSVEDDVITITLNAGFMTKCDKFKLEEEYDTDFQGDKAKGIASYTEGNLVIKNTPIGDNMKPTTATRELLEDGEMLMTMCVGDVVCKRWFKKQP